MARCMADLGDARKGLHILAGCLNLWAELGLASGPLLQPLVHAAVSIRSAALSGDHAPDQLPSLTSMVTSMVAPCKPKQQPRHRSKPSDTTAALLLARLEVSGVQGLALPAGMLGAVVREEVSKWMQLEAEGPAGAGMCWQEAERGLTALVKAMHPPSSDPAQHAAALLFRARCRLCRAAQSSSDADVVDSVAADLEEADELLQPHGDEATLLDSAAVHAMLALHLAAAARRTSSSTASSSAADAVCSDSAHVGEKAEWTRAKEARGRAVERLSACFSSADATAEECSAEPEGVSSDDLLQMMMELRYMSALQGSAKEQHQLSCALVTAARSHQDSLSDAALSALANSPAGCAMGFLLAPHARPSLLQACFGESMSGHPLSLASIAEGGDGTAQPSAEELRQMAADAAAKLSKGPGASLQRGLLHLLAAAQAHREGTLNALKVLCRVWLMTCIGDCTLRTVFCWVQILSGNSAGDMVGGVHDATEALRLTNAIAMPTGDAPTAGALLALSYARYDDATRAALHQSPVSSSTAMRKNNGWFEPNANGIRRAGDGSGQAFAGQWQALWLYLGCLLQCGDLYEGMGAFDDALHAFKEGLCMVS